MTSKNLGNTLIGGLLALFFTLPALAANLAGSAVFVSGKVTATDTAGEVRALKASDKIYSGDTLETRKGRVQIKFLDGAFMSIQPNSRFQVEDYNYANKSDGSEKAIYNLFKGGMRAFSGAIGKKHPDAYKVKTPVATIGIRGTGHNTRICNGDCIGSDGLPLPDGLYHSTWEGTTFVTNDYGVSEVPFGSSVYVQGIDTPAEETNEASQVTAVQPSQDTATELVEENQEQTTLEAGEQVNPDGTPVGVPVDPVSVQTGLNQVSVAPPQPQSTDSVDISLLTTPFEAVEFFGPAGPVGAFGTDVNDGPPGMESLATIDPRGILASTSPASAGARTLINNAMADPANDALFNAFFANPASIAEFTVDSGISFGRWANGNVLLLKKDGGVALKTLENDQSLHFIFGDSPATAAAGATGTYDFVGGTHSTGSFGDGVTGGQLTFDFDAMTGTIAMTVSHGLIYTIEGDLLIDVVFPALFSDDGTLVATTTSGNCADGGCQAFIDGSFFGSLVEGGPSGAGLEYDINEVGEVIKGVAAFTNVTQPAPPPPPPSGLTEVPNQSVLAIEPTPAQLRDPFHPSNADGGSATDITAFVGEDSIGTTGLAGLFGTAFDENVMGSGVNETLNLLITTDPDGMDGTTGAAKNFLDAAKLYNDGALVATIDDARTGRATVAEHTDGSFGSTNYSYGRWSDGKILFIDEIVSGPNAGLMTAEVDNLAADEFFHYLFGDTADTNFGVNATGTYTLLASNNGTASTGTHDGSVGLGVQSGSLTFDFTTLNGRVVDMVINHAGLYTVNGYLLIDPGHPGEFYDVNNRVNAVTPSGGLCDAGCETIIDGNFFGALAGTGVNGAPELAGLNYEILTDPYDGNSGNSIIGNAIFGRNGTANPLPYTVTPNQNMGVLLPNVNQPPPPADFGALTGTVAVTGGDSTGTPGLILAAGTEFDGGNTLFTVATINTLDIFALDVNLGSDEARALNLLNDARSETGGFGVGTSSIVASVEANPAKVAEFFQGDGFAFGRWADGDVLVLSKNEASPGTPPTAEVVSLANNQSFNFMYGDMTVLPAQGSGVSGTYTFDNSLEPRGTQSTSVSGATIGQGVTDGTLTFDFDTMTGSANFNVLHLTNYNVTGSLGIDAATGVFSSDLGGVSAISDASGSCSSGCQTDIQGGFAGGPSNFPGASPRFAGLEYSINAADAIIGVAVFDRDAAVP